MAVNVFTVVGSVTRTKTIKQIVRVGIRALHLHSHILSPSPPVMNFSQQMPFGVQQPGNMAQSQPSAMPFMNPAMSPTQMPSSQPMYNMPLPPPSTPPSWMSDLINDVKQIKLSLEKLDKIEKTVNSISLKVSTLETKVQTMDTTVSQVKESCKFISQENDDSLRKKELKKATSEIKTLKSSCKSL